MASNNISFTVNDRAFDIDVNRTLVPILLALAIFSIFGFC